MLEEKRIFKTLPGYSQARSYRRYSGAVPQKIFCAAQYADLWRQSLFQTCIKDKNVFP